jgi:hypothetical protein
VVAIHGMTSSLKRCLLTAAPPANFLILKTHRRGLRYSSIGLSVCRLFMAAFDLLHDKSVQGNAMRNRGQIFDQLVDVPRPESSECFASQRNHTSQPRLSSRSMQRPSNILDDFTSTHIYTNVYVQIPCGVQHRRKKATLSKGVAWFPLG